MKKLGILLLAIGFGIAAGCTGGDVDPHAKVDAPGYYNGPMKARGNSAGDTTAAPGAAKTTGSTGA